MKDDQTEDKTDSREKEENQAQVQEQHAEKSFEGSPDSIAPATTQEKETARQEPPAILNLVEVKFRQAGKSYSFEAGPLIFKIGEKIVVETEKGLGLGRVVTQVKAIPRDQVDPEIKRVVRKANWNDLERDRKNKEREKEAFDFCAERIKDRNLEMKLVDVEYFHDASKAIFYFYAENRVDFRDLVKDLAHHLHTRIEMKQIGVRDEAKILGGLGNCGQPLCCNMFLADFAPVSVRMAKDQNLSMNPAKVSGVCGRLMCCLAYEHPVYQEALKTLPKKGRRGTCPHGKCKVIDLNALTRTCMVELESGGTMVLPCSEIEPEPAPPRQQSKKQKPKPKDRHRKPAAEESIEDQIKELAEEEAFEENE